MGWVEKGDPPEMLEGARLPGVGGSPTGKAIKRAICPYPKVGKYKGGDEALLASWECADKFAKPVKADKKKHDEL